MAYIFRDKFTTDRYAGSLNGTPAEPGFGNRTVVDAETIIYTKDKMLRGFGQSTPVWGDARILWPAISRLAGRVMQLYMIPEDGAAETVVGLTVSNPSDPRTNGYGIYNKSLSLLSIVEPGRYITLMNNNGKSDRVYERLYNVVLDDAGAFYLVSTFKEYPGGVDDLDGPLGIAKYPSATVVWATPLGTDASLRPIVSAGYTSFSYPGGHAIRDLRIIDITSVLGLLKNVQDRFTRADSASSLGGSWNVDSGTWGISSNQAYLPSASGINDAWIESNIADCIVQARITIPTPNTVGWGLILRRQDADNYLRLWNNYQANAIYLHIWAGGVFGGTIKSQGGLTMTAGQTYLLTVKMIGNKYQIIWDDTPIGSANWYEDAGNNFINETKHGLLGTNSAGYDTIRWDDFLVSPHTITLPTDLQSGAVPYTKDGISTIGSDTFTDTNGTRLNAHTANAGGPWTEHVGTWTIQSNKATCSLDTGHNWATQDLGVYNAEVSVDITTPNSFSEIRAGIVLRYDSQNDFLLVRLFFDGTGEIELHETIGGSGGTVKKITLKDLEINTTYHLNVLVVGDLVQVSLDGYPEISYMTQNGSSLATNFGLLRDDDDDGCIFDNWVAKNVPADTMIHLIAPQQRTYKVRKPQRRYTVPVEGEQ